MVNGDFAKLTRKHGIKISAGFACTVEEIGLAVGEKVGHGSIKSLARMNSAVVIFLDQVEKVNCVIETGITTVLRLDQLMFLQACDSLMWLHVGVAEGALTH
ncbi:hypothetical protein NHX12_015498 [Muraenolepis orangiensis]|uniref:Uncharacterized protein n=1 Tax=Muraenolepis orangiensis TaxID=630683 RepID=A0A9Q0D8Z0_9TELE|nr:hypothetical protein NHX12_015498 [Muraenolepis orangiensis]